MWTPTGNSKKKIYKNKYSHEMTRLWIQIAIWSSLHKLVQISRSSHKSVFELSGYWVHNEHNLNRVRVSYYQVGLHKRVCIAVECNRHIHININTCLTPTRAHRHTRVHPYSYIYKYTIHNHYWHKLIHICIYTCTSNHK